MKSINFDKYNKKFINHILNLIEIYHYNDFIKNYLELFLNYLYSDNLLIKDGEHILKRNFDSILQYDLEPEEIYDFLSENYDKLPLRKISKTNGIKKFFDDLSFNLDYHFTKSDDIRMDIYTISKILNSDKSSKYSITVVGEFHANIYKNFLEKYITNCEFYNPAKYVLVGKTEYVSNWIISKKVVKLIPKAVKCVNGNFFPF